MDMKTVADELSVIMSEISQLVNKNNMIQYGADFERLGKVTYKVEHGKFSECVVVSVQVGEEPVDSVIYTITPALRVLNEHKVYECDYDQLITNLKNCIEILSRDDV
jgi:hypothetical protein